jgi:hypothetical protein
MECKEQQRRLDICAPEGGNMGVTRNLGVNTSNKEAAVSTRNLAETSFIFKSMYIPASLLEVLTPKFLVTPMFRKETRTTRRIHCYR